MKIKLTVLTAFCLLLFACPSNDDYNIPQVEVKEDNYLFEGEITREHFLQEFAFLEENDPNNVDAIQEAENNLNIYNEYIDTIIVLGPVLPPPPPCPDNIAGKLCVPTEGLFIVPNGVDSFFRILTQNGEEIAEVNGQLQTLPNSNGVLNFFSYSIDENIQGPVILEIFRSGEGFDEITYTINAGIRP